MLLFFTTATLCFAQTDISKDSIPAPKKSVHQFKKRMTAAGLAIAMGPLGVHRLYLGCSPAVPAAYVVTVGGGVGFIPLVDFFAILFTKDLSRYENNNQIFMWIRQDLDPEN